MIKNEYHNLTLGELQQIIIDGILQKYNTTKQPQYNDVPSLMFWLKLSQTIAEPEPIEETEREYRRRTWLERNGGNL